MASGTIPNPLLMQSLTPGSVGSGFELQCNGSMTLGKLVVIQMRLKTTSSQSADAVILTGLPIAYHPDFTGGGLITIPEYHGVKVYVNTSGEARLLEGVTSNTYLMLTGCYIAE